MKTLVTGGSGYLGTHVRRFFSADDFSRRANLNILDEYDVRKAADYDVVIHLAAFLDKDPGAADQCFHTNAQGTANVIRHMAPGSVFIYASTKDVYGSHASNYSEVPETCSTQYCGQSALEWSKLLGEKYVEYYAAQQRVRACIFRLSAVYARPTPGNESGFVTHYVESVKHRWPIRLPGDVDPVRDILFVDDFSRACESFVESARQFGLYNLGGGRTNAAPLREIIRTIGEMIQVDPIVEDDPSIPAPVPLNYVSDLSHIRNELRWQPSTTIEDGLRMLL
ncbi:MAG TPA: NAD(P)-dependent oxidoreductase [Pyrinomonadaceae bacterium]|nr:NAD(P)-dependent oxidoreductase [Pyrinomonadaceae bacterium]